MVAGGWGTPLAVAKRPRVSDGLGIRGWEFEFSGVER